MPAIKRSIGRKPGLLKGGVRDMSAEQEDMIVDRISDVDGSTNVDDSRDVDDSRNVDDAEDQLLAEEKTGKSASAAAETDGGFPTQGRYYASSKQLDATQLYLNEIGFSPLLTPEEEVYFARLARKGEESGRKRMIESNLRLVVKIARRYVNRGLTLLDLIEEGNLGLIRAV
jgi:RNA polymerase nonessential primary-like sigma factor